MGAMAFLISLKGAICKKKIGKPRFKPKWKKQRITLPGNLKQQLYPDLQY